MNGAAFSTYAVVLTADFQLKRGEVKSHKVSEHASKHFCSTCGTPIFNTNPMLPGLTILHLGSLDNTPELKPEVNIYCESQIHWVDEIAALPGLPQGIG